MYKHCIFISEEINKNNMQATIKKWGNSLAIRLPKPFTEQIGITADSKIEIIIENNKIIVSKKNEDLEDLVSKITNSNTHKETQTGKITGKEIW